ncbi:hydrogenase maturation protease [Actinacidiphila yeochonensis]|uniref:hydrogenase maturation protease n=1 Tax=Actinacidiphila yeochonensis TaxID=89050 RepID=UPI0007C80445|nr:hydrogenase maturation protease [Actinacidiphila yeochonensis]
MTAASSTSNPAGAPASGGRTLVAGLGNIFLGDDGFGVTAVHRLMRQDLPPGVETADVGVRGVHLAYQLLDGYDTVVLLDATARGGTPGTVYLVEDAEPEAPASSGVSAAGAGAVIDGHRMTPDAVLALLATLSAGTGGRRPRRIAVVGCEPACLDEGIGLSDAVAAAVDPAVDTVLRLLADAAAARRPGADGAIGAGAALPPTGRPQRRRPTDKELQP